MSSTRRLFLKNLPLDGLKRAQLFDYLSDFGEVDELKIVEGDTGQRYGFVQFADSSASRVVLETFRDKLFLGHPIVIEPARPLRKDSGSRAARPRRRYPVIVSNLPPQICWQELKDFGRLAGGLVAYCDLDRSKNGRGFIEYLNEEDAVGAVRNLNGHKLAGQPVRVSMGPSGSHRSIRSRSRSPARRTRSSTTTRTRTRRSRSPPSHQIPDYIHKPSCLFPISAERFSPRVPSDPAPFAYPNYPFTVEPAIPVVLHPVDSYHPSGLFVETEVSTAEILMPQGHHPSSFIDYHSSSTTGAYHDFDQYLRLEYLKHYNL
ncbi:hypothetical protein FB45DRAFT_410148 [Roridomyces roridus]|uniref:RRM domain-containing protein n=1 Tax=Roridomyces roridus TaxID=1738132 RepID=A0AAD7C4Q9_9AGAR|nr:hypothetical protein FB45DRAFT_410148 [Roridomyces roridus]